MIFPVDTSGAVIIRDEFGNPTNPPNVQNAYVPPPAFVMTCEPTALPSDCTARVTAAQINAIVSELLALAVCFDPDGPWDCTAINNLCNAFTAWSETHGGVTVQPDPPPLDSGNSFWWDSETGVLYLRMDDGTTVQWVQAAGVVVDHLSIIGSGVVGDPYQVGTIDCGSY